MSTLKSSVDVGAGEAVYLLPGLLCDQTVWAEQIHCLKESHRVVVADFRGQSSLTEMAAMVIDHSPDQFNMVGHSMGARVALEVMRLAPERVLRLGLLDTGTHPPRPDEPSQRQVLVEHEGRLDDAALMDPLRQMVLSMTPDIYKGQITALLGRPDASSGLAAICCPTLVGVGRQDRWSPPEQHEAIVQLIRNAYLVLFENSGHMAQSKPLRLLTRRLYQSAIWPKPSRKLRMTPLERMEIEQACTRQINRFAVLNDAHDHHGLAELFTVDGSFARPSDPDTPISGRSRILDFFIGRPKRNTKHLMGNTVVEALSPTQATARSEVILYVGQKLGDQVLIA